MLNDDIKIGLITTLSVICVITFSIFLTIWLEPYFPESEDPVIADGIVDDMRIEPERGIRSEIFYIISVDGKEVQIEEEYYNIVFIGYNVTVYESGKVKIWDD